jgi:hypothetical protein
MNRKHFNLERRPAGTLNTVCGPWNSRTANDDVSKLRIVTCPCGESRCIEPGESWRCDCGLLCECGKGDEAYCPMHGSVAARVEANK